MQLYEFIRVNEVVKLFYSIRPNDEACPPKYFQVTTMDEIYFASGTAILYNKQIILACYGIYQTFPNTDHMYVVRLEMRKK